MLFEDAQREVRNNTLCYLGRTVLRLRRKQHEQLHERLETTYGLAGKNGRTNPVNLAQCQLLPLSQYKHNIIQDANPLDVMIRLSANIARSFEETVKNLHRQG